MQKPKPGQAPLVDRRVQRTRDALRDALLALLPERGWDAIDVQTLCARANVGRSTFYLHFPDKAALLRGAFDDLQAHLLRSGTPTATGAQRGQGQVLDDELPFLPGLLAHVHGQQTVFRALLGRRSSQAVQDHFRELLIRLFSAGAGAGPGARRNSSWTETARVHALAGGLYQLLVLWLGAARPRAPAEIEAWFRGFARNTARP